MQSECLGGGFGKCSENSLGNTVTTCDYLESPLLFSRQH
eukprot:COSAG02_NODE_42844_length_380_cov_1.277580_1_plen_38_part_10